jgi:hypothetical protein
MWGAGSRDAAHIKALSMLFRDNQGCYCLWQSPVFKEGVSKNDFILWLIAARIRVIRAAINITGNH